MRKRRKPPAAAVLGSSVRVLRGAADGGHLRHMRHTRDIRTCPTILCVVTLLWGCQARTEPTDALKPAGTIPLDGVEGRIDHMAVDARTNRMYVAALGNNTVEVIDLKAGKQVGRIEGMKKPQGVAFLPDSNRLVVASGDDGKVRVYDE